MMISIEVAVLGTVLKGLEKRVKELEIEGQIKTFQIYSIVEIGQKTEKRTGHLRKLAATQTRVKNHQLMLVWKTYQE